MSDLYDRAYRIVLEYVGLGLEILPPTQVRFSVSKNLKPEPNKVDLRVYNLTPNHRATLERMGRAKVQIEAGYKGATSTIFLGELRVGRSLREGPDLVSHLEGGDSESAFGSARVAKTFGKGTPVGDVLRDVATALGVSKGNLDAATRTINTAFAGSGNIFPRGTVLTGSAAREMTSICSSLGLDWSIQNGKLQILERRKALEGSAVFLSPDTGLIEAPTVDSKGVLTAKALMITDVFPGRQIALQASRIGGQYRAEETQHEGDYRGSAWYVTIKARKL